MDAYSASLLGASGEFWEQFSVGFAVTDAAYDGVNNVEFFGDSPVSEGAFKDVANLSVAEATLFGNLLLHVTTVLRKAQKCYFSC